MHVYSYGSSRVRPLGLIAFLAVLLAIGANLLLEWLQLGPPWLISAPTVAASFAILYGLYETSAWRWRLLRLLQVADTPNVSGTYEGELVSSYNGTRLPVRIEIEQSWTRIIVRFTVVNPSSSDSISLAAALTPIGRSQARLTYTYRNLVRPGIADPDMNDHDGTAELTIDINAGVARGRYYNYRGRQGMLQLSRV